MGMGNQVWWELVNPNKSWKYLMLGENCALHNYLWNQVPNNWIESIPVIFGAASIEVGSKNWLLGVRFIWFLRRCPCTPQTTTMQCCCGRMPWIITTTKLIKRWTLRPSTTKHSRVWFELIVFLVSFLVLCSQLDGIKSNLIRFKSWHNNGW